MSDMLLIILLMGLYEEVASMSTIGLVERTRFHKRYAEEDPNIRPVSPISYRV